MTSRRTCYRQPIKALIHLIPFVSLGRKIRWAEWWHNARPKFVGACSRRIANWYTKHDRDVIFVLRVTVTLLPIVLLPYGLALHWTLVAVTSGIMFSEYLSRKREVIQEARWKHEFERELAEKRRNRHATDPLSP